MAGKNDKGEIYAKNVNGRVTLLKASAEQEEKIYREVLANFTKMLVEEDKVYKKALKEREKATKGSAKNIATIEEKAREEAAKLAQTFAENQEKQLTARQRFAKNKALAQEAKETILAKKSELEQLAKYKEAYEAEQLSISKKINSARSKLDKASTEEEKQRIQERINRLTDELEVVKEKNKEVSKKSSAAKGVITKTNKALDEYNKDKDRFSTRKEKREEKTKELDEKAAKQVDKLDAAKLKVQKLEDAHLKKMMSLQSKLDKAKESGSKLAIEGVYKEMELEEEAFENSSEYQTALSELEKERVNTAKVGLEQLANNTKNALAENATKLMDDLSKAIDSSVSEMYGQQGKMNARLQGLTDDFADHVDKISTNVGMSGVVSQKAVVAKMTELIDSGVAYNIELRSFLATTAENIASTFNALDETLLRIVRIQQADTTAARLGMEASLTRLFNETFKDSSYLTDVYDSVSSAIIDANSQMSRDQSLEFEYTLQKWLGSLYSVGMSAEGVSTIAQGISYLATGNVAALQGNDSLQTLLAMSAGRSNKSYADLLAGNVTGSDVNELLKAMVEYLAEIASSQENFVTKSAYADLFGMSITDLSTFASLYQNNGNTFNAIYEQSQNYSSMMKETSNQLNSIASRLNISQIVDTAIENALTSASTNIGGNMAMYGMWKALNLVEGLTGGIALPFVNVMGFGVDLNTTVTQLAKTGMAGLSLLGSLVEGLGAGSLFGTYDFSKWGYDEYNQSGALLTGITGGFTSGTSFSAAMGVGSASGEDVKTTSLQDASDEAISDSGVTSEEMNEGRDVSSRMLDTLISIEQLLDPKRVFYTSIAGVVSGPSSNSITALEMDNNTNTANTSFITSKTLESTAAKTDEEIRNLIDAVSGDAENHGMSEVIASAVEKALSSLLSPIADNNINSPIYVTPVGNWST